MSSPWEKMQSIVRKCHQCGADVKFTPVNYEEVLFMCENNQCTFPFLEERLRFVSKKTGMITGAGASSVPRDEETETLNTASIVSNAMGNITRATNNAAQQGPINDETILRQQQKRTKEIIKKHLTDIREMNKDLYLNSGDKGHISNQKWIRKLESLQRMTDIQLVKPKELAILNEHDIGKGMGELSIEVEPGIGGIMPSIRISGKGNRKKGRKISGKGAHTPENL